jgi:hypothetical protein
LDWLFADFGRLRLLKCLQVFFANHPRGAGTSLHSGNQPLSDPSQCRFVTHVERTRDFAEQQLTVRVPILFAVTGDSAIVALRTDTASRPGIAMRGTHAQTIEECRNCAVGQDPRQFLHDLDRLAVGDEAMLPQFGILKLGMVTALPMKHKVDLAVIPRDDDFRQHGA